MYDEFDPITLSSLSFTAPVADSLFYIMASTAIIPNFGVGLVAGVLIGAALSALFRQETTLQGFETPQQTARYAFGAMLMGGGAVLTGGCTVGVGLAGIPTLSLATIIGLTSIITGAQVAHRLTEPTPKADLTLPGTT